MSITYTISAPIGDPVVQAKVERIVRRIVRRMNPRRVFLFGSWATGTAHSDGDVDLLIISDDQRPFIERLGDPLRANDTDLQVEARVCTPQEWGDLLAEGRDFVRTVAEQAKPMLRGRA